MSDRVLFFAKLFGLSFAVLAFGLFMNKMGWVKLPDIFPYLVGYYFLISSLAFFINIKGTKKESDIAVWYYLSSVMIRFLLAAASVFILTKIFADERSQIIWLSFVLYPLFEIVVILDIYNRVRQ